jgi:hypothetical protein
MFRQAFEHRRCLVPADGFYEWKGAKPPKTPYLIRMHDGKPVPHLEVQGQNSDQLDRDYYDPRAMTDDSGHFVLSPMRGGEYSIHFCPEPGRILGFNSPAPTLRVVDGDHVDVGDMTYDGRKPLPIPKWYSATFGPPAPPPVRAKWRQITVTQAKPAAEALPPEPSQTPDEEELVGNPATPGTLSGKVVDEQGHPLSGVSIHIWTWMPGKGHLTDKNGEFSLQHLDTDQKVEIRYMPMGSTGMSEMDEMTMQLPKNTLPMMTGQGQFGPIEMGGMFTVLKVRDGITSYEDPGWYKNPPGTMAHAVNNAEIK